MRRRADTRGAAALALLLAAWPGPPGHAAGTGASFLNIPPTAASAVFPHPLRHEDGSSAVLNPGALAPRRSGLLSISYSPYLVGSHLTFLAWAHPLGRTVVGGSLTRLSIDDIDGRAADRSPTTNFRAEDDAYGVFLARSGLGAHLKLLRQRIGSYEARGLAADLGYRGKPWPGSPALLGVAVRNLGAGMRFVDEHFSLPTELDLSAAYPVLPEMHLAAGLTKRLREGMVRVSMGAEYSVRELLRLRAGYAVRSGRRISEAPLPSAGFGVRTKAYAVDYAFSPLPDLGGVHRFSVALRY